MPADFVPKTIDLIRFLPEIILTVTGTLLMVLDAFAGRRWSGVYGNFSLLALAGSLAAAVYAFGVPGPAFSGGPDRLAAAQGNAIAENLGLPRSF